MFLQSGPLGRPVLCIERVFQNKERLNKLNKFRLPFNLVALSALLGFVWLLAELLEIKKKLVQRDLTSLKSSSTLAKQAGLRHKSFNRPHKVEAGPSLATS